MNKILGFMLGVTLLGCASLKKNEEQDRVVLVYQQSARDYIDQGDFPKALERLKQALVIKNDDVKTHNLLGTVHLNLDQVPTAKKYFQKSLSMDKSYHPARLNLASCLIKERKYSEALSELSKIPSSDFTPLALLYHNIGLAHYHLKQYAKADHFFNQAVVDMPTYYPSLLYKGMTHYETGDYKNAIVFLQRANKFCEKCADPYYYLALTYKQQNNHKKSLQTIEKLLTLANKSEFTEKVKELKKGLTKNE